MQITYVRNQQDFIDAQRTHAWRRYSPTAARIQKILTPIFGFSFIAIGVFSYYEENSVGFALFEVLCGLYVTLFPLVITPLLYRRAYRRRLTAEPREHTLTIDQNRIESDSPGRSHATLEWVLAKGIVESRTSILIYFSAAMFLAIPKRVLSEAQKGELQNLLRQKNIPPGAPRPIKS